jgi:D-alanyl-D-alanine carboxypeptidase
MHIHSRFALKLLVVLATSVCVTFGPNLASAGDEDEGPLQRALERFVSREGGPPGIIVVVTRGKSVDLHTAGVANLESRRPIHIHDHMRLASVAKAFSGAASLSLVASGQLSLDDTIRQWVPELPQTWWPVTLAQLLNHISGIPDYTDEDAFIVDLFKSLQSPPPPHKLLEYVGGKPPSFDPGTQYRYSNSDNIIVGLMVEAATGRNYADVLTEKVYGPLGLTATSLPEGADLPAPYIHGYFIEPDSPPEDASVGVFAAGWAWASGGIVATPADANRFVRGYAAGKTTDEATHTAQFKFVKGHSEPTGPGKNTAGLGIFRYKTKCGTVYGHTGNTPGYTQFVASTKDGTRSATVTATMVLTQRSDAKMFPALRKVFEAATCAALAE